MRPCRGRDRVFEAIHTVGAQRCCNGGYQGLYDMGGNVLEWEDSCDGSNGSTDGCLVRGGAYFDETSCSFSQSVSRDNPDNRIGFRCCSP